MYASPTHSHATRTPAYAPGPAPHAHHLTARINLDEEVKLPTNPSERDLTESLAEIYSILVTLDALERAYLKDSVPEQEYVEVCSRLLKQYKSSLAEESVARAFGDLESFKREWSFECPRATERIRVGISAAEEQPSRKAAQPQGGAATATLIVEASECFITLLDGIKIEMRSKDQLHPLLAETIQAVNKVTDREFDGREKIVHWLITLNQMRAAEELTTDQARDFEFDMTRAYNGFKTTLE